MSELIATAKVNYNNTNTADLRKTDIARWHKEINTLTGASSQLHLDPPIEDNLWLKKYKKRLHPSGTILPLLEQFHLKYLQNYICKNATDLLQPVAPSRLIQV